MLAILGGDRRGSDGRSIPRRRASNVVMKSFCVSVGILLISIGLAAQTPARAADGPSFEAATIRLNNSGARGGRGSGGLGGRYASVNITASNLVLMAYGVRPQQVINGPSWMNTEHYDINAIGPEAAPTAERRAMWRHLLEERFRLKVHHEQRSLNAANLVLARSDGKLGPKLTRGTDADADCTFNLRDAMANGLQVDLSKFTPPCGMHTSTTPSGSVVLSVRGYSMEKIGDQFSGGGTGFVFVFDKTGVEGVFNVSELEYRPAVAARPSSSDAPLDVPELFTAIQEQLGLKLEPVKEPVDVIVIDSIQHPDFD